MEIIDNKALLIRTRDPSKYGIIPRSKYIGEEADGLHQLLVYWGLDEARVLLNLGVKKTPSPILRDYNWPGRYKPMAHQKETASFLTLNKRAFVFNDPGMAKTISSLWAADYLMQKGKVRRVLVLAPLSILHSAWMGDISKSVIHRSAIVAHHAQAARRIEMVQGDYEIVIMNFDGLPLVASEIVADGRFDLVICDEASAYKTATTRRWKTLKSILRPDTYLWMMTGTPAAQSPEDAYGLAKLVNPDGVPQHFGAWRDKVMYKVTMFKWAPKPTAKDLVHQVLQPAIRFTKKECLDLPPVVTETREVPLTAQQQKYYRLIKEQMLAQAAGETISAVNAAAGVSKLLQISAGAALTDNQEVVEFDATPRLNVLQEIMQETDRKVIIFALFRASIVLIAEFLKRKGYAVEQIHGDITASRRGDIINRFQTTAEPQVLVLQPQAAAHGITLTAADTVVFYGPLMSIEQYVQAVARADRQGQTADSVRVVHIQGSPIERKMFTALEARVEDHSLLSKMFEGEIKNS